jgi:hypothetical protein
MPGSWLVARPEAGSGPSVRNRLGGATSRPPAWPRPMPGRRLDVWSSGPRMMAGRFRRRDAERQRRSLEGLKRAPGYSAGELIFFAARSWLRLAPTQPQPSVAISPPSEISNGTRGEAGSPDRPSRRRRPNRPAKWSRVLGRRAMGACLVSRYLRFTGVVGAGPPAARPRGVSGRLGRCSGSGELAAAGHRQSGKG